MKAQTISVLNLLLILGIAGCFSGEASPEKSSAKVPEQIKEAEQTWNKAGLPSEEQQVLLEDYLKKNSTIVENPIIKGLPYLYRNENNHVRFYWFLEGAGDINWLYIEFDENKFVAVDEGSAPQGVFQ